MVRFEIIGELRMISGAQVVVPRGPKIRKILALLLLSANRSVRIDLIAEELWNERPPRSAEATIRTHIYHLRHTLAECGAADLLVTQPSGYLLRLGAEQLDVLAFEGAISRGHALLKQGEIVEGTAVLRGALRLCHDRFLATVRCGPLLEREVARLERAKVRTLELCIEAEMKLGRHQELIAELRDLAAANPLDEWCHTHLVRALYSSGHRTEALHVYHGLRRELNEQLGLEPSAELNRLQYELLTADRDVA